MKDAARHVATLLQGLGHHVDETVPVPLGLPQFLPLWQRTLAWVPIPSLLEHRLQPITRWLREAGCSDIRRIPGRRIGLPVTATR
jgi:amidase